ncbi:MAG TPA: Trp biosynthesis-associated membrane protein [Nocardioides sp.]
MTSTTSAGGTAAPRSGRRTFGPVVLLGLAASGLVAFGGTRPWVDTDGATGGVQGLGQSGLATTADVGTAPLAGALGLVLLACWGVVLVTRRWFRRVVAGLAAVAALGVVAAAVTSARTLPDDVSDQLARSGQDVDPSLAPWLFVTGVAGLVAALAAVAAVRLAPAWPEMGARYDAPADATDAAVDEPRTSLDLWKALDEGHDPTR